MKKGVFWYAGEAPGREISTPSATCMLRPGDWMLVTSRSTVADLIDLGTRGDSELPRDCPRLTHSEMVKRLDGIRGPVVVSTEWGPEKKDCGFVEKDAARQFGAGISGMVFRNQALRDQGVLEAYLAIVARKQAEIRGYDFVGAMLASDMVRRFMMWIPAVKKAAIYQTRAQHCSRTNSEIVIELDKAFPGRGINPYKPGDEAPETIDPREAWAALDRSEREAAGWAMIMRWAL